MFFAQLLDDYTRVLHHAGGRADVAGVLMNKAISMSIKFKKSFPAYAK